MKKITFLRMMLVAVVMLLGSVSAFAQTEQVIYTTGFESAEGFAASTSYNNTTVKYQGPSGQEWGVFMGTASTTGPLTDLQSMQMRSYKDNYTPGSAFTNFDLPNVTKLTFVAKAYNSSTENLNAYYSTDGGSTWSAATSIAVSTANTPCTYTISTTGEFSSVRVKIEHPLVNVAGRLTIDDVQVYGMISEPTITVSEQEPIPSMSAQVGNTDTETITVNGANLTANITLAVSGDDASLFTLSRYSITQSGGSATDESVTITYTPTAAGSHAATLTLSSDGADDVVRSLSGTATWPPLDAPVANAAGGIGQTGFTADWTAVDGATEYELSVYTKDSEIVYATDLFISEYVEGSSNNKAIEIYNGTGSSVDLSNYSLKKQTNGVDIYKDEYTLSGTLANNEVFVIANSSSTQAIKDVANVTTGLGIVTFNGNDAVALFKNGIQIDEVGVFNQVDNWGADVTLVRKSNIGSPKATYDAADWGSYAQDNIANLGSHTYDGLNIDITHVTGSPFTVTDGTSKAITGLTPSTTYYYSVKAKNTNVTSEASSEISVVTSFGTSTDNPTITNIYAHNANIYFTASAGEKVEVYNAVGQKIISTLATDGQNELPVNAKGVMIVKVGSRLAKVIL